MSREPVELDAEGIVEVLNRQGVRYVVIGGYAGVLHGSPRTTEDLDITPDTAHENLERLANALRELDAKLMPPGAGEPLDWPWSAEAFAPFTTLTTRTRCGDLDICLRPDAPGGKHFTYGDLARNAVVIELDAEIPVASLEDVIASKEASGRDKDARALPELRDLLMARELRQRQLGQPGG